MVFGGSPSPREILLLDGQPLKLVTKYKFIGIWFSSKGGSRGTFKEQYVAKRKKAYAMAAVAFAAKDQTGVLSPGDAVKMYWAMIDPHLTFGAEFILDEVASHLDLLQEVQKYFLRKALGVSGRSVLFALYTETGVMPIQYRRVLMALTTFERLMIDDASSTPTGYGLSTTHDLFQMDARGEKCWLSRLRNVLSKLPDPVSMPAISLELAREKAWHKALRALVVESSNQWLRSQIMETTKCGLLRRRWIGRGYRLSDGGVPLLRFRDYLKLKRPDHRVALTKLLLSDHPLAVEVLRRGSRYNPEGIPHDERLCRFCRLCVEDEAHALVGCTGNIRLVQARTRFLADIWEHYPTLVKDMMKQPVLGEECLALWIDTQELTQCLASYVHNVFAIYEATEYVLL